MISGKTSGVADIGFCRPAPAVFASGRADRPAARRFSDSAADKFGCVAEPYQTIADWHAVLFPAALLEAVDL